MQAKQASFQAPQPEVKIYDPKSDKEKLYFSTASTKTLREYSFKTSVDDVKGQFSLTFYPDEYKGGDPIFDKIEILDIVMIYESGNHSIKKPHSEMGITNPNILVSEAAPAFIGVIRSIKYDSKIGGTSVTRKMVVSGHSVAGLTSDFYLNMDSTAMAVTQRYRSQENFANNLSTALLFKNNEPRPAKEIIDAIWDEFIDLANSGEGEMSNPDIFNMLKKWVGEGTDEYFTIDENFNFNYPLGCIFDGKTTKAFFDLIEGIVPEPVYEKFAYMDHQTGKMRIMIRECPFDAEQWGELKNHKIPLKLVKSLNIERSDNEVYTVFFSYLDNSPISHEMALKLKAMKEPGHYPSLKIDETKYRKYGYRPLFAHFKGYGKNESEEDKATVKKLTELNQRLMDWYGNLELMYNGQIALSNDLSGYMPQAGEKIYFLGAEFYVTAAEHRWAYKGNPETILTVTRGGHYIYYNETETTETSDSAQTHVVIEGDKITELANRYNTKAELIVSANQSLLAGRGKSPEGHPWIYAGDKLIIPPDPDNAKSTETKKQKMKFYKLDYWGIKKRREGFNCRALI